LFIEERKVSTCLPYSRYSSRYKMLCISLELTRSVSVLRISLELTACRRARFSTSLPCSRYSSRYKMLCISLELTRSVSVLRISLELAACRRARTDKLQTPYSRLPSSIFVPPNSSKIASATRKELA